VKNKSNKSLIFLVGFMGAGKTTTGRTLAQKMGWGFIDLDEIIESHIDKSVQHIFADMGEDEFRRIEQSTLKTCAELERMVISLGGGAYISEENRRVIDSAGISVLLECPVEVCLSRVEYDGSRPLLKNRSEVQALFERRMPYYRLADFSVSSAVSSPVEIADQIIELVARSE